MQDMMILGKVARTYKDKSADLNPCFTGVPDASKASG